MSYQVLARKWRPKDFTQMVGQEHVLRALINALDEGRMHHAYLFTGTRGVGKTTIARIIAKSLNCEQGVSSKPCGQCATCREVDEGRFVDLIEVDAASRTKVEDTRELLENVQYAPTRGRYKVYLIDEVHMLSTSSFNALLKTLEEPPEHVKFLLATTDPQKLPATVLSRCLQFNLKRMPVEQIVAHHTHILTQENIAFEPAALSLLARAADGSMRDSLSLLDQSIAFGNGQVTQVDVANMLGSISYDYIEGLIRALIANEGGQLMQVVANLAEHAPDFMAVLDELITVLHQLALVKRIPSAIDADIMDEAKLDALAQALSEADIQLYYQIALMGKKDLPLAPNARTGFEMVMLRMLAFAPTQGGGAPQAGNESFKKQNALGNPAQGLSEPKVSHEPKANHHVNNSVQDVFVGEASSNLNAKDSESIQAVLEPTAPEAGEFVLNNEATEQAKLITEVAPQSSVNALLNEQPDTTDQVGSGNLSATLQGDGSAQQAVTQEIHLNAAPSAALEDSVALDSSSIQDVVEQSVPSHAQQTEVASVKADAPLSHVQRRAQLRAERMQASQAVLGLDAQDDHMQDAPAHEVTVEPKSPIQPEQLSQKSPEVQAMNEENEKSPIQPVLEVNAPAQPSVNERSTQPNHSLDDESESLVQSAHQTNLTAAPLTDQSTQKTNDLTAQAGLSDVNGRKDSSESLPRAEGTVKSPIQPESNHPSMDTNAVVSDLNNAEFSAYADYAQMVDQDEEEYLLSGLVSSVEPPVSKPTPPQQTVTPAQSVQKTEDRPVQQSPEKPKQQPEFFEAPSQLKPKSLDDLPWHELLEHLTLSGMPMQLAQSSELVSFKEQIIQLRVSPESEALLNKHNKELLQNALTAYLGQDCVLSVKVGACENETPAQRKQRLFGERHMYAVDAIMKDPNVQLMQTLFGAHVNQSLVKPMEIQP